MDSLSLAVFLEPEETVLDVLTRPSAVTEDIRQFGAHAIWAAVHAGYMKVARVFLEAGADLTLGLECAAKIGETAFLDLAVEVGALSLQGLLRAPDSHIESICSSRVTAEWLAFKVASSSELSTAESDALIITLLRGVAQADPYALEKVARTIEAHYHAFSFQSFLAATPDILALLASSDVQAPEVVKSLLSKVGQERAVDLIQRPTLTSSSALDDLVRSNPFTRDSAKTVESARLMFDVLEAAGKPWDTEALLWNATRACNLPLVELILERAGPRASSHASALVADGHLFALWSGGETSDTGSARDTAIRAILDLLLTCAGSIPGLFSLAHGIAALDAAGAASAATGRPAASFSLADIPEYVEPPPAMSSDEADDVGRRVEQLVTFMDRAPVAVIEHSLAELLPSASGAMRLGGRHIVVWRELVLAIVKRSYDVAACRSTVSIRLPKNRLTAENMFVPDKLKKSDICHASLLCPPATSLLPADAPADIHAPTAAIAAGGLRADDSTCSACRSSDVACAARCAAFRHRDDDADARMLRAVFASAPTVVTRRNLVTTLLAAVDATYPAPLLHLACAALKPRVVAALLAAGAKVRELTPGAGGNVLHSFCETRRLVSWEPVANARSLGRAAACCRLLSRALGAGTSAGDGASGWTGFVCAAKHSAVTWAADKANAPLIRLFFETPALASSVRLEQLTRLCGSEHLNRASASYEDTWRGVSAAVPLMLNALYTAREPEPAADWQRVLNDALRIAAKTALSDALVVSPMPQSSFHDYPAVIELLRAGADWSVGLPQGLAALPQLVAGLPQEETLMRWAIHDQATHLRAFLDVARACIN